MIAIARTYAFAAPRERVWQLLMDTKALSLCIPGCSALDPDAGAEHRYRIKLAVKLAAVMGTYDGIVQLVDLAPMDSYGLVAEGNGRPGFVKGKASIALSGEGNVTTLTVAGEVQAGGAIARVGQRIITSAARMMMDRFFKRLKALAEAHDQSGAEFDVARLDAAEVNSAEAYLDTPTDES